MEKHMTLDDYVPDQLMLLTVGDLEHITGLSRITLLKLAGEGNIPEPFRIGSRHAFWFESDIVAWLREKRRPSNVSAGGTSQSCLPLRCPSDS